MSMLELSQHSREGWTVVTLDGEVDLDSVGRLRQIRGEQLIIDLSGVRFIDTTGLGFFVRLLERVRRREGSLVLVALTGQPLRAFSRTNLMRLFPVHDSVVEALATPG